MSAELERCYDLLGVKPGASVAELKAAHRDMAKVWHPDRFGHDTRLQQKAQEKLKEINQAFEILISGKVPRSQAEPRNEQQWKPTNPATPAVRHSERTRSFRWQFAVLPILIFIVVFGYTLRSLLTRGSHLVQPETTESVVSSEQHRQVVAPPKSDAGRERRETDSSEQVEPQPATPTEIRPMATITVTIDPASGLLARSDCPSKTRMTYPTGNEPHDYCAVNHQQPTKSEVIPEATKTSRVKSITKKVVTRLNGETKSNDWSSQK